MRLPIERACGAKRTVHVRAARFLQREREAQGASAYHRAERAGAGRKNNAPGRRRIREAERGKPRKQGKIRENFL